MNSNRSTEYVGLISSEELNAFQKSENKLKPENNLRKLWCITLTFTQINTIPIGKIKINCISKMKFEKYLQEFQKKGKSLYRTSRKSQKHSNNLIEISTRLLEKEKSLKLVAYK